eukprot:TRINITY_DN4016_c1_g1_i3.p1 TRINITY_DN4016_c1_g1~~TRINITY_DN4016_c1_g1_i3.p1  ORF type:complete len:214 (-),score=30.14 TRINITY_DN4016_c1_g1_i3:266-907(-)
MNVKEEELSGLYSWVDEIPLSRPKRNIARDFSDGVLMAEVMHYYCPKVVELHNYSSANSSAQKSYNWNTLNEKVFKKFGFSISQEDQNAVVNCEPGSIERILKLAHVKLHKYKQNQLQLQEQQQQQIQITVAEKFTKGESNTQQHENMEASTKQSTKNKQNEKNSNGDHRTWSELEQANTILQTKVRKLEQLVKLKDVKIETLMAQLESAGLL